MTSFLVVETSPRSGLLHYTVQLADGLAARGNKVDLLVPRRNELEGRHGPARMRAVLARHIGSAKGEPSNNVAYNLRRIRVAVALTRAWSRIFWEAARGRYDAVVLGSDISISVGALVTLAMTYLPPKLVFICHNVRPYNRWGGDDLYLTTGRSIARIRRVYSRCDLVVVHGESARSEFEKFWPKVPIAVIPHGNQRLFAGDPPAPAEEPRVLFFGDLRKVKGLPVLMQAFDQLVREFPSARLTIAGTPAPVDFDPEIIRRWAQCHSEQVELLDHYIPVEEVAQIFGRARVVVAPYLVGYQSGVVHLAMTMARAVVATEVGDLPAAVIDGETGFVVPPGDPEALAAAMKKVISEPELADSMGAAGHRRMLQVSSWETIAAELESQIVAIL